MLYTLYRIYVRDSRYNVSLLTTVENVRVLLDQEILSRDNNSNVDTGQYSQETTGMQESKYITYSSQFVCLEKLTMSSQKEMLNNKHPFTQ